VKINSKYVFVAVLVVAIGFLAYDSVSNYLDPYTTVSQIVDGGTQYQGENLQIMGTVVPGTLSRAGDGVVRFDIGEKTAILHVTYSGTSVQNLGENTDVVVSGVVSSGSVEASQILVKCPSKYEPTGSTSHADYLFYAVIAVAVVAVAYFVAANFWKRS
jgi:cytochrome c-type biogenesis protein CcmE